MTIQTATLDRSADTDLDDTITTLIQRARQIGVSFPSDPQDRGVQIRVTRDATPEARAIADELRGRRAEVNAFMAARRPAWPARVDDGYGPLPDIMAVGYGAWEIRLEVRLAQSELAVALETVVADFDERMAAIISKYAGQVAR